MLDVDSILLTTLRGVDRVVTTVVEDDTTLSTPLKVVMRMLSKSSMAKQ